MLKFKLQYHYSLRFCGFGVDPPLALEIDLVAGDGQVDVGAQHLPELLDPILDLLEAVLVGYVVNENSAVGVSVVDGTQSMEAFLA